MLYNRPVLTFYATVLHCYNIILWHMPHGITLIIAPKNSKSYHLLWNCSTKLPESTTAGLGRKHWSLQLHHIPSVGPLSRNFLHCPEPLLTTSISLPRHFSTSLLKPRGLNFFLHEDCPENLTQDFYCRNKLLGSNSTSKAQRTS